MTLRIYGEAPSRSSDPRLPLAGRSGSFLAELIGATPDELRERAELRNLLRAYPGPSSGKGAGFDREAAEASARRELRRFRDGDGVVLLGRRVARAFGVRAPYLCRFLFDFPRRRVEGLVLPHPSGVNRYWNEPENREAASRALRALAAGKE